MHGMQASAIVNRQDVARGLFPSGAYVSSNRIDPDYFSESAERHRESQVTEGMPFLHSLIHRKIAHAIQHKATHPQEGEDDDKPEVSAPVTPIVASQDPTATDTTCNSLVEGTCDEATLLSLDNLVFVKTTSADRAAHKLATVRDFARFVNYVPLTCVILVTVYRFLK